MWANRVAHPLRSMTGIGRYVEQIVTALAALPDAGPDPAGTDLHLQLCAPPESATPGAWLPPGVAYRPARLPRSALNGAWLALGRPALEAVVGPADLVHALHPAFPLPTAAPGVITVHDLMPLLQPQWSGRLERIGFRRSLQRAVDAGWTVITDSQFVADQIASSGIGRPARVHCVPLGWDPRLGRPLDDRHAESVATRYGLTRGRYFIAVGRIAARKNLATVLDAMAALGPAGPVLALAGPAGSDTAPLAARLERLDLQHRVRLLGFVPDGDMVALLQGARGLLHPALDEGFGLPALEGLAAGTPVVASAAGSLPEILGGAGLLVDPSDPAAWADGVARLAGDDDMAADLRRRGRERAAQFGWDRAARETVAAYRATLQAWGRRA